MEKIICHEKTVSGAIKKQRIPGTFTLARYSFSPYMACSHGCAYCDGRAERYYVEGSFDRDIIVRQNLPDRLMDELPKLREKGVISIGSGITDAYQPAEQQYGLMRRCAEILSLYAFPVVLMTKSSLVLRDLDLWKRTAENSDVMLMVSLTMTDDSIRQVFEPVASAVEERLETLRQFKAAGCRIGVLAMPLLPGITAEPQALTNLYDKLAAVSPDFIMPGGLTLRPGRQKDFFLERLKYWDEGLLPLYADLYRENRTSGAPLREAQVSLNRLAKNMNRQTGIPAMVPHRLFKDWMPLADSISVLLGHMIELYDDRGRPTGRLKDARQRYNTWLDGEKRIFNRKRSLPSNHLEQRILEISADGTLGSLLANQKLLTFLQSVIHDRAVFDYNSLSLTG